MAIISRHTTRESDGDYQVENPDLSSYHANGDANGHHHHGGDTSSMVSEDDDDSQHLQTIEAAMAKLHRIHNDAASWDKALKHKHGVDVFVRKDVVNLDGKDRKIPIYKGELTIEGFTPSAVFAVTAQRDLWDDWYDHGNLVADLNDRTSITYMNMKPPGTARPRDMALVERVDVAEDGSIWFCATSTESVKVPQVHGRTRAYMALNGWVLTPLQRNGQVSTQLAYYVQAEAQGLLPGALAAKMLARRPVAIYRIAEHLRKNGAPPNKAASSQQRAPSVGNGANGAAAAAAAGPERKHATNSEQAQAQALESTLPPQVPLEESHGSAKAANSAKRKIEDVLSDSSWQEARDSSGSAVYQIRRDQGLPIVRGTADIKGYTTEQILGTIASTSARRVWDEMFASTSLVEQVNGADQAILVERRKGVHPHLPEQRYSLARAVFRDEPYSDNGHITHVSTSHDSSADSNAKAEYLGWKLIPSNSGDNVHVERVASTSLSDPSVPDFVERILVTAEAAQPRRLQGFLNKHGHAPFFLRWGKGKATLDEELEGDIAQGKTSWRIGTAGKEGEQQVAWLQWDPKMYPKGISLTSEATIKLSRIDGTDNTAQLAFGADLPSDGFTLQAERAEGSSSGDVFWNGQKVTGSISAPQGAAQQRKRPATVPTSAAAGATAVLANPKREEEPASVPPPLSRSTGAETGMGDQKAIKDGLQAQAAELTTLHRAPRLQDGTRQLPEDAMLILTRDLYFTRSQMAVVGILMAIVFALARLG